MQISIEVRLYPDGRMDSLNTARYIGCSEKTLANMRSQGIGPAFVKRGRVFYYKDDVDAWLRAGRVISSAQAHGFERYLGSGEDIGQDTNESLLAAAGFAIIKNNNASEWLVEGHSLRLRYWPMEGRWAVGSKTWRSTVAAVIADVQAAGVSPWTQTLSHERPARPRQDI